MRRKEVECGMCGGREVGLNIGLDFGGLDRGTVTEFEEPLEFGNPGKGF